MEKEYPELEGTLNLCNDIIKNYMGIILNKISKKLIKYITTEDVIGDFVYKQRYFYKYSYRFMGIKKINGVEFIKLDNVEFVDLHYYYIPMFEVEDKCLKKLIEIVKTNEQ